MTNDGPRATAATAHRDRQDTIDRLVAAAYELVAANGILDGFTLRDVAEKAGVARTNIYHHFGTRQELLRQAVSARIAADRPFIGSLRPLPFTQRWMSYFRNLVSNEHPHFELMSLLLLDGQDVDPIPAWEEVMAGLDADLTDGKLDPDGDWAAFAISLASLTRGYDMFRVAFASRVGIPLEELDERVFTLTERWLDHLTEPAPPN